MSETSRPALDLAQYLRSRGVDEEHICRAEAGGPVELRRLAQAIVLLGAPPSLTPPEVWREAGADEDLSRRLWRAMGFAHLPDDADFLTAADVRALRSINDYLRFTGVSPDIAVRFTRLLGQTMGRVADALLSIVDEGLSQMEGLPDGANDDLAVLAAEAVTPIIEEELVYLLRRHLYAGVERRLASSDELHEGATVGFADVVSFTRLSGQLPESHLAELLERFETTTSEEIVEHGGRVVKLIGDAVLFVFDSAEAAAECALHMVERFGGDHPDLRVGLAHGPYIDRLGDIFGPTVNLASRLVGFARPGTVLVDLGFADEVGEPAGMVLRSMRPREVKGIGVTPMYVLRRARGS